MSVAPDDLSLPRSRPYTAAREDENRRCSRFYIYLGILVVTFSLLFLLNFIVNVASEKNIYAEVPTIKIDSITVSNFHLSNPISAHWNINMTMHSTDSSFEFSDSTVSILHKSEEEALWMTRLKRFDMRPKNTTVHFALDFGGLVDVNDTAVKAIGDKIRNNHGAVELIVQFKADHSRSRNISWVKKFYGNYATMVNHLFISCDVLLHFGCPDKTRAYMLMTKYQTCRHVS